MDQLTTNLSNKKDAISFEQPKPAYYAVIPASVRFCRHLEAGAKLLYGDIAALCHNEQAHCWATNGYLAKLHDVDERTIKRWLESLVDNQFISIEVIKDAKGTQRYIQLQDPQISVRGGQNCPPGGTKMSHRQDNFVQKPLSDSPLPNNTMNNTRKKTPTPRSGEMPAAHRRGLRANGTSPRQLALKDNLAWANEMIRVYHSQAQKLDVQMHCDSDTFYVTKYGSPYSERYSLKYLTGAKRDHATQTLIRMGINFIDMP